MPRPKVGVDNTLATRFNRHGAMTDAAALATVYKQRMFVRPVRFDLPHIKGWVYFVLKSEDQQWQSPA